MIHGKSICLVFITTLMGAGGTACVTFPESEIRDLPQEERASAEKAERDPSSGASPKKETVEEGVADSSLKPKASGSKNSTLAKTYGPEILDEEPRGDRILARVDDQSIMASDLYQYFFMDNPMKTQEMVQHLVLYKLVRNEAGRLGIRARGEDVDELVDEILKDQQDRIAMKFDEELKLDEFVRDQYGLDMASYRILLQQTAVFRLLLERNVRYLEFQVRRLVLGVIIVKDKAQADRIHKKLKKGASFEVVAQESSLDPSASRGGILPPLPADMDYPIVRDCLKLGLGEISGVEEADLGSEKVYRILKLVDIIEPNPGSYPALEDTLEASLKESPLVLPDLIEYWHESMKKRYNLEYHLR